MYLNQLSYDALATLGPQTANTQMSLNLKSPGTYILLLKLTECQNLTIGRSRSVQFEAGLYVYVGSALGPGGLAARLGRHARSNLASDGVRKHWHIDYLLPHVDLLGALVIADRKRYECQWAAWVAQVSEASVDGFGASDCKCRGHLFYLGNSLDEVSFIECAEVALGVLYVSQLCDIMA